MGDKDPYISHKRCADRLFADYLHHRKLIIAFDFDNTVYDFHKHGDKYPRVVVLLRRCAQQGHHMMCFTAASDMLFVNQYLQAIKIPFDSVNENHLNLGSCAKPYYNILLDDRAGLESAVKILEEVLDRIDKDKESD